MCLISESKLFSSFKDSDGSWKSHFILHNDNEKNVFQNTALNYRNSMFAAIKKKKYLVS